MLWIACTCLDHVPDVIEEWISSRRIPSYVLTLWPMIHVQILFRATQFDPGTLSLRWWRSLAGKDIGPIDFELDVIVHYHQGFLSLSSCASFYCPARWSSRGGFDKRATQLSTSSSVRYAIDYVRPSHCKAHHLQLQYYPDSGDRFPCYLATRYLHSRGAILRASISDCWNSAPTLFPLSPLDLRLLACIRSLGHAVALGRQLEWILFPGYQGMVSGKLDMWPEYSDIVLSAYRVSLAKRRRSSHSSL